MAMFDHREIEAAALVKIASMSLAVRVDLAILDLSSLQSQVKQGKIDLNAEQIMSTTLKSTINKVGERIEARRAVGDTTSLVYKQLIAQVRSLNRARHSNRVQISQMHKDQAILKAAVKIANVRLEEARYELEILQKRINGISDRLDARI